MKKPTLLTSPEPSSRAEAKRNQRATKEQRRPSAASPDLLKSDDGPLFFSLPVKTTCHHTCSYQKAFWSFWLKKKKVSPRPQSWDERSHNLSQCCVAQGELMLVVCTQCACVSEDGVWLLDLGVTVPSSFNVCV